MLVTIGGVLLTFLHLAMFRALIFLHSQSFYTQQDSLSLNLTYVTASVQSLTSGQFPRGFPLSPVPMGVGVMMVVVMVSLQHL